MCDETTFWSELPDLCRQFPDIIAQIDDDDGVVFIAFLKCRWQGEGIGTRFMQALCDLADRCGVDISADPAESGGDRLVAWYERFGFFFETSQRLVRVAELGHQPRF